MTPPPVFARWDILNPTNITALILFGWGGSVFHRPNLPTLLPSYMRFDDLMPWNWWGWIGLATALALILTPRSSLGRLLAHAVAGTFFLAVSTTFASGVGATSAFTTYMVLAVISGVLFARTLVHWASTHAWWRRTVDNPPPWLRRLAQIEIPEHESLRQRLQRWRASRRGQGDG